MNSGERWGYCELDKRCSWFTAIISWCVMTVQWHNRELEELLVWQWPLSRALPARSQDKHKLIKSCEFVQKWEKQETVEVLSWVKNESRVGGGDGVSNWSCLHLDGRLHWTPPRHPPPLLPYLLLLLLSKIEEVAIKKKSKQVTETGKQSTDRAQAARPRRWGASQVGNPQPIILNIQPQTPPI